MKIYAFEVREDEKEAFQKYQKQYGAELVLCDRILEAEDIEQMEKGSGITVLGMRQYGEAEFAAMAERGIFYLSTRTIGYNHIDLEAAKKYGIHVCNASYAPNGVADYTVMMILLCLRNYKQALWRSQVNDYSLDGLIGRELNRLTVGVVGTGRIGAAVVKNLSGFGCRILACDHRENPEVTPYGTYVSMEDIYRECDIITLHMPLLPDTMHLINDETIAKMKDGVVIINCARGELTDVKALIRGIESEKIGALGLDCMEKEENIVHKNLRTEIFSNKDMAYLRQFKNVVHTQHMAFYTDAAVESMVKSGVGGIVEMASGRRAETQLV